MNSVELATEPTSRGSRLGQPVVPGDVSAFLEKEHATIEKLSGNALAPLESEAGQAAAKIYSPAVSIRKSLRSRELFEVRCAAARKIGLSGKGGTDRAATAAPTSAAATPKRHPAIAASGSKMGGAAVSRGP